jgi:NAD(P)-dependent dehydrogenase (short-subunit alcohol dehydrogenase family)
MRLKDKVTIITGSGSGIGREIALTFAREGAKVVIAEIHVERAEETAKEVEKRGGESLVVETDVKKSAGVDRMVVKTMDEFKKIDILVNNAGILLTGYVEHFSEEDWDMVLNANLKAYFLVTKRVVPEMSTQGKGKIINIASVEALVGAPALSAYSASKGGVISFTRAMAIELAPRRINVNCICPGVIETAMTKPALDVPAIRQMLLDRTPLYRFGQPSDIANAALFLASDESDFVTGHALVVDGGMTIMM